MTAPRPDRPTLAARLRAGAFVVAPGVHDVISARLADRLGFDAIYMTGYGSVASALGLPDAGLATYTEMVDRVARMARAVQTPLIGDGDTGYGGLLNVRHTVRGYEAAGAAGIQLEDQEFPKKCGHTPGRRVIPAADMVKKLRVAVEARTSPDFLIVARTDARASLGLDEALRRAEAYLAAGADVLFVESPESEAEMARIGRAFDVPLIANMVEGGRTPLLPPARLQALGFRFVIHPVAALLAATAAIEAVYAAIRRDGTTLAAGVPLYDFAAMNRLVGFEEIWEFERRWADPA